jgi:hypothetical protein
VSPAIAEILEKAASLIEPEGAWIQIHAATRRDGTLAHYTDAECFCLHGAISAAAYSMVGAEGCGHPSARAYTFVCDLVRQETGAGGAIEWNDAPGRTQAEVVAKLREAAALTREQVSPC